MCFLSSAMGPALVVVANQTTQYVCSGSAKKLKTRSIPKGLSATYLKISCRANAVIRRDSYVEMLEQQQNQLVSGLQELYALMSSGASWKGAPLKASVNGHPLTHDILERLGVLKLDMNVETDAFEEDLDVLRQKLTSETDTGTSPHRRSQSSDSQSHLPFPGVASPRHYFGDSFHTLRQFPPTPPIQSPNEEQPYTLSPIDCQSRLDSRAGLDPSVLQSHPLPMTMYDESLDFLNFDLPPNFDASNPLQESLSPCLSISPWLHDDLNPFGLKASDT